MKEIQPQKNFVFFFFISELQVSCDQLNPSIGSTMDARNQSISCLDLIAAPTLQL